ncbi:MAG: hypothetical protein JNK48_16185 [Bryobacterales bacterium]|nr:hypothetical protein [Bryobacterales bacterium]
MKFRTINRPAALAAAIAATAVLHAQQITTIAGTGAPGSTGDGGDATAALLTSASSLAVNPLGDLFILDAANNRVRKLNASGTISTVAGNGEIAPAMEGPATASPFVQPYGVSWGGDGRLYLALSEGLYAIDDGGQMQTVIGDRSVPVVALAGRTVYLSDFAGIYRREPDGALTLVAGSLENGNTGDGEPATNARFGFISSLAADRAGRLWVADSEHRRIRRFTPGGLIDAVVSLPAFEELAQNGARPPHETHACSWDPGGAERALCAFDLAVPISIAVDAAANLYIGDPGLRRVYRVRAGTSDLETIAGTDQDGSTGDGGKASEASFAAIAGIAVNCPGVSIGDTARVRRISLSDPLIALNGVRDAESGEAAIRSGRAFRIEGCHLSETVQRAPESQALPTLLGGAQVLVNGTPVGLASVSPGLIEARLPDGWTRQESATLRIEVVGKPAVQTQVAIR